MTEIEFKSTHPVIDRGCALVDRSERGKLALTGAEAKEFLDGQVTNDIEALEAGHGRLRRAADPQGQDARRPARARPRRRAVLDTERGALQALFDLLRRFKIGFDVELHKRTLERGLLSLIGPRAREVAAAPDAAGRPSTADARARAAASTAWSCATTSASTSSAPPRTPRRCAPCWPRRGRRADRPRTPPTSCASRPGARASASTSTTRTIPQEAGLNERAVSFTKGCYVGQETVARLHYKGKPNRHLRGLRLAAPVGPGAVLRAGEREVGRVGTRRRLAALGPIALAMVRREARAGRDGRRRRRRAATVVELPFALGRRGVRRPDRQPKDPRGSDVRVERGGAPSGRLGDLRGRRPASGRA